MKLFYLHGFNSGSKPRAERIRLLQNKEFEVVCLDYDSSAIFPLLVEYFDRMLLEYKGNDIGFVGTSLGGFWANFLGDRYGCGWVSINPSLVPSASLKKYLGKALTNYVSGEKWVLGEDVPDSYSIAFQLNVDGLVILDKGDEVIDSVVTIEKLDGTGVEVISYEGGGHQFDHWKEAVEEISFHFNSRLIGVGGEFNG
ncbi:hypothetical protein BST96_12640 [Oceanicoccus sagamiensis]|uniref:Esterase n=2 Tax=Oceanicoccus sagamiensis TaxID=716816 RepID=A0A1X9NJ20_9GAMM|nr:hypothetical protein BST96_12640 [Oceanicoccus sagamiensis]